MNAHTPGPWKILPTVVTGRFVVGHLNNLVTEDIAQACPPKPHASVAVNCRLMEANAHLIAAAPDLLAVAKLALSRAECELRMWALKDEGSVEHQSLTTFANKLRAAITSATGGAS